MLEINCQREYIGKERKREKVRKKERKIKGTKTKKGDDKERKAERKKNEKKKKKKKEEEEEEQKKKKNSQSALRTGASPESPVKITEPKVAMARGPLSWEPLTRRKGVENILFAISVKRILSIKYFV
ncbi:hypothetical protein M8J76_009217 [Diaphorina citri]|nr:hypothetical protein M8J76_009217 [Diaphorina citri]